MHLLFILESRYKLDSKRKQSEKISQEKFRKVRHEWTDISFENY